MQKTLYFFSLVKYNTYNETRNARFQQKEKKKMKKILSLILAASVAVLCFAGCGKKETAQSDSEYVKSKGKLIVGITEFEPMDYEEVQGSGNWIGFDADMAKAFAKSLGVEAEFTVINWDNKTFELDGKSIDCVWNGMTLTDGVKAAMSTSNAYCVNEQVVVVKADKKDIYNSKDAIKSLNFAAEGGSAGEEVLTALGYKVTPVESQADAVKEVASGTADAAVIDLLMAGAVIGEGTSYENLVYTISLSDEKEYGVGFRKDSDLTEKLNAFFLESYKDGTLLEIAKKYGVQESVIKQK